MQPFLNVAIYVAIATVIILIGAIIYVVLRFDIKKLDTIASIFCLSMSASLLAIEEWCPAKVIWVIASGVLLVGYRLIHTRR